MANKLSNKTEPVDRVAISHTLELAKRDTQKDKCWISEALDGEMTCRKHSEYFSTIVYTRGELQKPTSGLDGRTDGYLRGKIEVVPSEKSCIFDLPIADRKGIPGCCFPRCSPEKETCFREELINHHFANRVHVYDRFKGEEYMERLLDKAAVMLDGIKKRVSEAPKGGDIKSLDAAIEALTVVDFTEVVEETPLLSTRLLDNVPFSVDLFGGQNGPNAQAWTRRLKSDDPLLECQHIRHLMIRKGDKLLTSIVHRTFSSLIPLQQLGDIDHVAVERYCRDRYALFDLEWSLLSNLESLCLDIRGINEERHRPLETLFVKMGKHLRLKTLVLIGVPHLIDFNSVGSKEYVAQQEDDEFLVFPGDKHNPSTELTNYIHFLKECLCPGGELRLVVTNSQT
ncbi:hypothetical protein NW755_009188 [Fusarium falciforme]|uniref:Uncharacterized protein n=1 Tax=Fusarium falciforme TaxID=195108 RepID=A0A9W8R0F4_9HYPO|nr:hypothetical protein NW755_009188 [Fusarium falciforme]KAJ4259472.1 hypothetical protein NW757_002794 [Fusarium falciforme]